MSQNISQNNLTNFQKIIEFHKQFGLAFREKPKLDVFAKEPNYYDWMMNNDFPQQTKKVLTKLRLKQFNNK